jgi:hypothetical protein
MDAEWKTSKEWADQLGLSVKGFLNRAKRGHFDRRGRLYRSLTADALSYGRQKRPLKAFDVVEHLADIACQEFHDIELRYMSDAAQAKWRTVAARTLAAAEAMR